MLTTGTLPATKTRTDWQFAYIANGDKSALADGLLVITEETGKVKKRTVTSTYAVQFETPVRGCRCLLLCKAGHAGNLDTKAGRDAAVRVGEVYRVTVAGSHVLCSCPGFSAGGRMCKHAIAVRELLATGDLPDPLANVDADHTNTERQFPEQDAF